MALHLNDQPTRIVIDGCTVSVLSPLGPAIVTCHHGYQWVEGSDWGERDPSAPGIGAACQPCSSHEITCLSPAVTLDGPLAFADVTVGRVVSVEPGVKTGDQQVLMVTADWDSPHDSDRIVARTHRQVKLLLGHHAEHQLAELLSSRSMITALRDRDLKTHSANEMVPAGTTVILSQSFIEEGVLGDGVLNLRLIGTASDHQPLAWAMDLRMIATEYTAWADLRRWVQILAGERGSRVEHTTVPDTVAYIGDTRTSEELRGIVAGLTRRLFERGEAPPYDDFGTGTELVLRPMRPMAGVITTGLVDEQKLFHPIAVGPMPAELVEAISASSGLSIDTVRGIVRIAEARMGVTT